MKTKIKSNGVQVLGPQTTAKSVAIHEILDAIELDEDYAVTLTTLNGQMPLEEYLSHFAASERGPEKLLDTKIIVSCNSMPVLDGELTKPIPSPITLDVPFKLWLAITWLKLKRKLL